MNIEETIEKIKRQITIGECEKNIGIPVYISDLKAVLSELEKKDDQIEYVKNEYGRTIEEKDAVINEMAKYMVGGNSYMYATAEDVKREFYNKVEREGK